MTSFIKKICDHRILSPEEERELGLRAFNGCQVSKDMLVACNLRLVVNIAKKFNKPYYTVMEAISLGVEGLKKAADRYNPDKARFTTYATHYIRGAILNNKRKQAKKNTREVQVPNLIDLVDEEECMASRNRHSIEALEAALDKLLPRDRYLLKARFGFPPHARVINVRELAKVEGVSRQTICNWEKQAMERLRAIYRELP